MEVQTEGDRGGYCVTGTPSTNTAKSRVYRLLRQSYVGLHAVRSFLFLLFLRVGQVFVVSFRWRVCQCLLCSEVYVVCVCSYVFYMFQYKGKRTETYTQTQTYTLKHSIYAIHAIYAISPSHVVTMFVGFLIITQAKPWIMTGNEHWYLRAQSL